MAGLLTAMFAAVPVQAQGPPFTYSGNAYAVGLTGVSLVGGTVTVPDQLVGYTGLLPASGGQVNGGVGVVTLPSGLGTATIVAEQANGANGLSTATSQVAGVSILPTGFPGGVLSATVLNANSSVFDCAAPTLGSNVATLTIGGTTVTIPTNPAPNTVIPVLIGGVTAATVTLNQQTLPANGGTVIALVVDFPAAGPLAAAIRGTVTISQAHSDLTCTATAPTPTPTATPTAPPGLPVTGAGPGQPPFDSTGLLAVIALLLISASTGGVFIWRRRSHLTS